MGIIPKRQLVPRKYCWLVSLVSDVCIVLILGIVTATFRKSVSPTHVGYQCDDPRLQLPYKSKKTVSNAVLYGVGFGLPASVMILTESYLIWSSTERDNRQTALLMVQKSSEAIVPFFFGGAMTHLSTNIPKYAIGRLRPNFFDVCKPNMSGVDCSRNNYIDAELGNTICTEKNQAVIDKARVAFPSGHASLSMFFMLYLIIYLQRRMTWTGCYLLRHAVQLILFYAALYCGITRLWDNLHHWEDVLAGDVLGGTIAVLVSTKVRPVYTACPEKVEEHVDEDKDTQKDDDHAVHDPVVEIVELDEKAADPV